MPKLQNVTQNQHFVSQTEQRLNAINPSESDRRLRRIFEFALVDKDNIVVALDAPDGVPIKRNLAFNDLFSLDIQGKFRLNLEAFFEQYERDITLHTRSILAKANTKNPDINAEFIGLFKAKFLNALRNPYSVKKVLSLLGDLSRFTPTDPEQLQAYKELQSPKIHQDMILKAFQLTFEEYRRWLQALLLLVVVKLEGRPLFDHLVESMLNQSIGHATIHRYSQNDPKALCLLCDRAQNDLSPSDKTKTMVGWDFNLTSKAFIRMGLANIGESIRHNFPGISREEAAHLQGRMQGRITVSVEDNDLKALENYNVNAVHQCAQRVFCAGTSPYGVHVARRTRSGAWQTSSPSQRSRTRALALAAILRKSSK